jgi:hypothetical protein
MEKKVPPVKKTDEAPHETDQKSSELSETDDEESLDEIPEDLLLNESLEDSELDSILTEFDAKPQKISKINHSSSKITTKAVPNQPTSTMKAQSVSKTPASKPAPTTLSPKLPMGTLKELTIWLKQKKSVFEEITFITILRKIPATWGISNEEILIDLLEKLIEEKIIDGKLTATSLKFNCDSL